MQLAGSLQTSPAPSKLLSFFPEQHSTQTLLSQATFALSNSSALSSTASDLGAGVAA